MNESVMISIKPKWCELIASGKKTIEVRKTKPKCKVPFKCYIYCTNDRKIMLERSNYDKSIFLNGNIYYPHRMDCSLNGKVIGEFICDFINSYTAEFVDDDSYESIHQVFDGEDNFAIVSSNEDDDPDNCFLLRSSCISFGDLKSYVGINFHEKPFYGWHISDLVIYDEPKELKDFELKRPPQSWFYVEAEE